MPHPFPSLAALLPEDGAALVTSEVNRRYLTGFSSSMGVLLITRDCARFLADSRYIEAARAEVQACETAELTRLREQLPALLREWGISVLLLEAGSVTLAEAAQYRKWLPDVTLETGPALDQAIEALRVRKRDWEVARIRQAQRIAEAALTEVRPLLQPGRTEREIALALDYAMLRGGADALSFETIAVGGENSAKPHGVPGGRALRDGDFLTLDFGAVVDGYHSDMTRTIAIGTPSEEMRRVYKIVLAAQEAALAALRPGLPCREADAAAREIIAAAGYGDSFRHGLGHGVGVEIHEAPTLSARSEGILAPGHVVTIEPGIYLPGRFGVRVEDMALITESGYENLTAAGKELSSK
ncbi:MAG: Xaa-Pro peptidase family protein [Oscillospiraceae bacterium]|jgi:Xaa-Pro aminopeptidase|nr:Xaa-Pro peptidase family protein [Oscillospiraceae bacterium]